MPKCVFCLNGFIITTAWHTLRLWMYETNSRCCKKLQMLNMQMWTANKEWSSNLGVGQRTNSLFPPQIGQLSDSHEHGNKFLVPGMLMKFRAWKWQKRQQLCPSQVSNPSHRGNNLSLY